MKTVIFASASETPYFQRTTSVCDMTVCSVFGMLPAVLRGASATPSKTLQPGWHFC
jgi:hypothetical protein